MKRSSGKSKAKNQNDVDDPLLGDLTPLLLSSDWHTARFELTCPKRKTITLRISEELLSALKRRAKSLGLEYQRFIRMALERTLQGA